MTDTPRNMDYQNLFEALAKAQGEMDKLIASSTANVKSDKANYSYKYADLADVLKVAQKAMSAHGLGILQVPEVAYGTDGATVSVGATLFHSSGEFIPIAPLSLRVRGGTAQEVGSAITYARRYQLQAVLGLAPDDDDDGNTASQQRQQSAQQKPQAQPVARYVNQTPPVKEPTPIATDSIEALRIELDQLGTAHFGTDWPAKKAHNVKRITGQTDSGKLTPDDIRKLIEGLKKLQAQQEVAA